jgi:ribosome-associated heat shock protein Hsp15
VNSLFIKYLEITMKETTEQQALRIDKWLWAARFFKTRALAAQAVKGGKVEVNGQRAKPAKMVRINDELRIRRDPYEYIVTVLGLTPKRGPASQAATLYQEFAESIQRREALSLEFKAQATAGPQFTSWPSKRDRRRIVHFTGKRGS